MTILLDSSAYSAWKRGQQKLAHRIRESDCIALSTVVVGELMAGFRYGGRTDRNLAELQEFVQHPRVRWAPVSEVTADRYGRIYADLRQAGTPIPTNDIWIAAQTMETGAELLTGDEHFRHVAGLVWTRLDDL